MVPITQNKRGFSYTRKNITKTDLGHKPILFTSLLAISNIQKSSTTWPNNVGCDDALIITLLKENTDKYKC